MSRDRPERRRTIAVDAHGTGRIGAGAWARLVASAIVPDEGSARAERGRELARAGAVSEVIVADRHDPRPGSRVERLGATRSPSRRPRSLPRVGRGGARCAESSRARDRRGGTSQSVHLALFLESELHDPLVPPTRRIRTSCTCPDHDRAPVCKHVAALAFVVADAIDPDPVAPPALARLRARRAAAHRGAATRGAPARSHRPARCARCRPGPSSSGSGGAASGSAARDLAEALEPAYRAFARVGTAGPRPGMIEGWSSDSAS